MAVGTGRPDSTPAPTAAPASPRGGGAMSETISLGRIAGIHVGLNWSMLLIFWLVVWSLASQLLPDAAGGQSRAAYWAVAVVGAVLFYASLLAHEVSHALVARRRGVVVEGITLWLFGGVARLRGEASTAGAELRISIVGPLASLACGAVFALLALLMSVAGAPVLYVAMAVWLSVVNGALAVFNIVPAFPLDGGRVLRSVLWRVSGDKTAATRTAARAGSIFGYLLIAGGVLQFFTTSSLGGLWFVFLGWFLVSAARTESTQSMLRDVLRGVRVADVLTPDPVVVPDWIVLQEFIDAYAMQYRHTTFPVRDFEGRITGLVSLGQVKLVPPERRRAMRVRDIAIQIDAVPTTRGDEQLTDLLQRMNGYAATRALVFDGDRLAGIVSPSDVARIVQLHTLREHETPPV